MNKIPLLIVIIFSFSCKPHGKGENKIERPYKIDHYDIKVGENLSLKEWQCETISNNEICFPNKWHPMDQKSFLFFAYLDSLNKEEFFVIGKINKEALDINEADYLKETYQQLVLDTIEILVGYDLKKLIFEDGSAFYAEYNTNKKGNQYSLYSMTFSEGQELYDITLRINLSEKEKYNELFQYILYNFKVNGKYYFTKEKEIIEFQNINPT